MAAVEVLYPLCDWKAGRGLHPPNGAVQGLVMSLPAPAAAVIASSGDRLSGWRAGPGKRTGCVFLPGAIRRAVRAAECRAGKGQTDSVMAELPLVEIVQHSKSWTLWMMGRMQSIRGEVGRCVMA